MERFLTQSGVGGIEFLHNNCFTYDAPDGPVALCGTRGWFYEEDHGTDHDDKMRAREVCRLKASLNAAKTAAHVRIYCFVHYPPVYGSYVCDGIVQAMEEGGVHTCFYGHLHGPSTSLAFNGDREGTHFQLISADYLHFCPFFVEKI